ncbi:MAG: hypothetical protein HXY50_12055 [Ignavibacteriaceae bacterium]|nr:hypothetical protein [Ignavibacteriaceae bacterium]
MKRLFVFAVLITIFLFGCSNQENEITNPALPNTQQFAKPKTTTTNLNLISELESNAAEVTKIIDGKKGDTIHLNQFAKDSEGRVVEVDACFKVLPGAFSGTIRITMSFNADNGCISFLPSMVFDKSCSLDYRISNCNFAKLGFTPEDKKAYFVFFGNDGSIQPVNNSLVIMNQDKGELKVNKAKIDHFSRYGFFRKAGGIE